MLVASKSRCVGSRGMRHSHLSPALGISSLSVSVSLSLSTPAHTSSPDTISSPSFDGR